MRKVLLLEERLLPLGESLSLRALVVESCEYRKELVAAHADERADVLEADRVAELGEHLGPGDGVRIVAVEERAVDVEESAAQAAWPGAHVRAEFKNGALYPSDRSASRRRPPPARSCT